MRLLVSVYPLQLIITLTFPSVFAEFIDDEDDILLSLAEELGNLIELVGGASFAHLLFTPLETLAGVEESSVRDKVSAVVGTSVIWG